MPRTRLAVLALLILTAPVAAQGPRLGPPDIIADGVGLYRIHERSLLDPQGPIAIQALRLEPSRVKLEIAVAEGNPARETVDTLASRRGGVIAAINAGFFSMQTGKPTDVLKVDGRIVHGTGRPRGAVGILDRAGTTRLLFDRVTVSPPGKDEPAEYRPLLGSSPADWAQAQHAISGAGLLMLDGRELKDWREEQFAEGFDTTRHPRTVIGVDGEGAIWLITVDGRNERLSLGMSFTELQRLSRRLGLRSVLNLDGGGSTTMWIKGRVINAPSDKEGPRKVSDAILVLPR